MRIALTGGIACGKSLLSKHLNQLGVETLDADDIVHELIPADERRRLAQVVFADSAARKALEARIHPLVKARLLDWQQTGGATGEDTCRPQFKIAVVPLLFETGWNREYDIICCVASDTQTQVERMMSSRGYTREEALARLSAQMPVAEKAARSHYIIHNNGSEAELHQEAERFVQWLKNSMCSPVS